MLRWRTHLALTAVLALLVPATAMGQNPGDEQYSDPLAPNEQPGGGGGGSSGSAPPPSASGSQAGGESESAAPSQAPSAGTSGELPRTGAPAGLLALLGVGMLAAGGALRRRLS